MPHKPKALVLDSWSVIAYLEDGPSAARIADLMAEAHEQEAPVYLSVVNASEVWSIIAAEISEEEADNSIKTLRELRIQFAEVDWELARSAARLQSRHGLANPASHAAGLAEVKKADLVTGDSSLGELENLIQIEWV